MVNELLFADMLFDEICKILSKEKPEIEEESEQPSSPSFSHTE